jgi:uncharacterized protein (TIGR02588 family)
MTARFWRGRSTAEWVTLGLSLLVVGILIAIAIREESDWRDNEAGVTVTFDEEAGTLHGNRFYVPYTVTNTGADAISSAEIWIEVFDGERRVESAEITVEFVPREGTQDGIYVSAFDPATHTLRGRLESLQFP